MDWLFPVGRRTGVRCLGELGRGFCMTETPPTSVEVVGKLAGPLGLACKAMDQEHLQELAAPHIRPGHILQAGDNCLSEGPFNRFSRTDIGWGGGLGRRVLISGARRADIFSKVSR